MDRSISTLILLMLLCINLAAASDEMRTIVAIAEEHPEWEYGVTSVSHLSDADKAGMAGALSSMPMPDDRMTYAPSMPMYPAVFDWREHNGVTPVKHQGSCGSCWAFSSAGAIESKILIDEGKTVDLSEQFLISCTGAGTCAGGWPDEALKLAKKDGIPPEECLPYAGRNNPCDACDNWKSTAWKIEDCMYVAPTTDSFKFAIQQYGPLSVVITVPEDWYYYRSGVYTPAYVGDLGWANHAVMAVGWNDTEGCWIVKNSWGKNWGEKGYARVKYGILEKYNYAYAVTGIVEHGASPNGRWITPTGVSASSEYPKKHLATSAIDNDLMTMWFATIDDPSPSITFDVGRLSHVSAIRTAMFRRDIPMCFDVDSSIDGKHWDRVLDDVAITTSGVMITQHCETKARYIRITDMHGPRIYTSLAEFEVQVEPNSGLFLTLDYGTKIETIDIGDLVSLTVTDGSVTKLLWAN